MRSVIFIFCFFVITFFVHAQEQFRTIVPGAPVIAGESFQVQFVIWEPGKVENFLPPSFQSFRFVSGPNQYTGSVHTPQGMLPVINIVYTLQAKTPGRFTINGAYAMINQKPVRSNDAYVVVISKEKSAAAQNKIAGSEASGYFLKPGEDPYEKIRNDLFLKVFVSKTSCFVGEPVQAIFKLYSRLESSSAIIKNPGFYGFTVYDMINLSDKETTTETVNGKIFDVHTIRMVQLFPLQAGLFTVDAMEIKNNVEFSRSAVYKKTEQEIVEGMPGAETKQNINGNSEVFETTMKTIPVPIRVKPLPENKKLAEFDGAVGNFQILTRVQKHEIAKNENGFWEVIISGAGNFTQLNAPVIDWPEGVEGFEPLVTESLDKNKFPLLGTKTFRYAFISSRPGSYSLPSVSFTFFDPRQNDYKTIASAPVPVTISKEEKKNIITGEKKESVASKNRRAGKTAGIIIILLFVMVIAYLFFRKEKINPVSQQETDMKPATREELLHEEWMTSGTDKEFCIRLHRFIWNTMESRLGLEGSDAKKDTLFSTLSTKGVNQEIIDGLLGILTACENRMYSDAPLEMNREKILADTKEILETIFPS